MIRSLPLLTVALLTACNPPAADRYVARVGVEEREAPALPITSPDTDGAVWVPSASGADRLIYGKPGEPALFSLECATADGVPVIEYTRFALADARAKAILALIGNGHVARLKIDAEREEGGWLWRGREAADSRNFEGFTGARAIEATVPGAGSVMLNPGPQLRELVQRCRAQARPADPASAPAEVDEGQTAPADTRDTAAPPPRHAG